MIYAGPIGALGPSHPDSPKPCSMSSPAGSFKEGISPGQGAWASFLGETRLIEIDRRPCEHYTRLWFLWTTSRAEFFANRQQTRAFPGARGRPAALAPRCWGLSDSAAGWSAGPGPDRCPEGRETRLVTALSPGFPSSRSKLASQPFRRSSWTRDSSCGLTWTMRPPPRRSRISLASWMDIGPLEVGPVASGNLALDLVGSREIYR